MSAVRVLLNVRPLREDTANRLTDLAASFAAALYDSQTGHRFTLGVTDRGRELGASAFTK